MAARFLLAVGFGLILALAITSPAFAGELRLTFQDGRVTLHARDVPLRDVLAEWERVGGTRVFNRDAVPGAPVTLDFVDVAEARALATLLRAAAGYLAVARSVPAAAASQFARIVIMPGAAGTAVASQVTAGVPQYGTSAAASQGPPQLQRRVMADGRVASTVENPDRPPDITLADDEQAGHPPPGDAPIMVRVEGQSPSQRVLQVQGPAQANPFQAVPRGVQGPESQAPAATLPAPSVLGTATIPGKVVPGEPAATPPPYVPQQYVPQPPPTKPPGI